MYIDDARLNDTHLEAIGGYLAEAEFYTWLTGFENLMYFLEMKPSEIFEYKSLFYKLGMSRQINEKYGSYSLSNKQRFALIYLFMQNKDYLILDEPMSSLDIDGIKNLKTLLLECKTSGKGILVICNRLEELEDLCDEVVILNDGNIRKIISDAEPEEKYIYQLVFSSVGSRKKAELFINSQFEIASPNTLRVTLKSENEIEEIIKELSTTSLIEVVRQKQSAYDMYMYAGALQ
jgi:ABC-type multidrug transport system ATPase subunit